MEHTTDDYTYRTVTHDDLTPGSDFRRELEDMLREYRGNNPQDMADAVEFKRYPSLGCRYPDFGTTLGEGTVFDEVVNIALRVNKES